MAAEGFWAENGRYVTLREAHGHSITKARLHSCGAITRNYLVPRFGDQFLDELTIHEIEDYFLYLYKSGVSPYSRNGQHKKISPRTVNTIRSVLKTMLGEAERLGIIKSNPAKGTIKFKENPKERGTLSIDEIKKLMEPEALLKVWRGNRKIYVLSLVAISTGMRVGELRGLLVQNVHDDYIFVRNSYSSYDGLKAPKWSKERFVPLPSKVAAQLHIWISDSELNQHDFVFFQDEEKTKPVTDWQIRRRFYWALEAIGIDEEKRRERNICFHSLRHSLVKAARVAKVDDFILRHAVGHSDVSMLDHYSNHVTADDMGAVREFQEKVFV